MSFGYPHYESPAGLDFKSFTARERSIFFHWFLNEWTNRVLVLKEHVERDAGPCNWGSRSSIERVAAWIKSRGEKVERTDFEISQMLGSESSYPQESFRWTVTDETMTMGFDFGLLFALDVLAVNDEMKWILIDGPKSQVDYNQPGLIGAPLKVHYSPFLSGSNLVFGLVLRDAPLKKSCDLWDKLMRDVALRK